MAKRTRQPPRQTQTRRQTSNFTGVLLGLLGGVGLTLCCVAAYFYLGHPPIAATDKAALWEPLVQAIPLKSRALSEAKPAPFPASEEVFEAAAHTYRAQCSQCHGTPGAESALGRDMVPRAQQFFAPRERRAIATQAPGEVFWKTAFGIRRSGMPAYNRSLSNTQLWQLSLLLHSAGDELPTPVQTILTAGVPSRQPTVVLP
ncbi:MAG: c-type cytochrome [Janthinobacterium lividum]